MMFLHPDILHRTYFQNSSLVSGSTISSHFTVRIAWHFCSANDRISVSSFNGQREIMPDTCRSLTYHEACRA